MHLKVQISHVVFDFDGLLVDTEVLYTQANQDVLEQFGKKFTKEHKAKMMGRKKAEGVQILLKECGLEEKVTVDQYNEIYDKRIDELMQNTKPLPGADKLIRHLHKNKIPLGICTGSDSDEFKVKTTGQQVQEWLKMIPIAVCLLAGNDPEVKAGKPSPDPYNVLIKQRFPTFYNGMGVPEKMENVLVFEDSINGVKSALAAGCTAIMVPQREFLPNDWPETEADLRKHLNLADILDSLEAFRPEQYGLPPF